MRRNIEGEQNLPEGPDGLSAVRRFAQALYLRPPGDESVTWYKRLLSEATTGPDLVLHGPVADSGLPDELCRLMPARRVFHHLGRPDTLNLIPAAMGGDPAAVLENWLRNVCSPAYLDFLDRSKLVSGRVPTVFSTFEADRNVAFPRGTRAEIACQVVGVDKEPTLSAHALLKYRRSVVGPARVPTAFDASTHLHFVPPPVGAPCGTTRTLLTSGSGVREIVVAPFRVEQLDEPEFVEA